jgi:Rrf2 family nitric oxide-sensitive transcriptional repressor
MPHRGAGKRGNYAFLIYVMSARRGMGQIGRCEPARRNTPMRLTMRTSLAMRTLMFCAVNRGRIVRRQEVAEACGASENHLAQVIHLLAQKKFLHTIRGRSGGLMLGRPPTQITVGQVFREFERVLPFSECMQPDGGDCPLRASLQAELRPGRGAGRLLRPA